MSTTYYAPSSPADNVAVIASSDNDSWYEGSEGSSTGQVGLPGPKVTTIQITPSSFSLDAGDSIQLTAIVTSDGLPVAGKLITWSANAGSFSPQSAYTDAEGKAVTTYTAPADARTVSVSASFAGDLQHQAAQVNSSSTVNPRPIHKRPEFWALVAVGIAGAGIAAFFVLRKRGMLFRKPKKSMPKKH